MKKIIHNLKVVIRSAIVIYFLGLLFFNIFTVNTIKTLSISVLLKYDVQFKINTPEENVYSTLNKIPLAWLTNTKLDYIILGTNITRAQLDKEIKSMNFVDLSQSTISFDSNRGLHIMTLYFKTLNKKNQTTWLNFKRTYDAQPAVSGNIGNYMINGKIKTVPIFDLISFYYLKQRRNVDLVSPITLPLPVSWFKNLTK